MFFNHPHTYSYICTDAHEFLISLLNDVADALIKRDHPNEASLTNGPDSPKTFVHELFQGGLEYLVSKEKIIFFSFLSLINFFSGYLVNETKCMCCEEVTTKDESFFDLSLDIEANLSITK